MDEDNYALMASIDLSAAFDVVNIDLLLERLRLIGLPADLVALIQVWLKDRFFYVEIGDLTSILHSINSGTIQGSILGPLLYALFVSPLFDLAKMTLFADDNYIICHGKQLSVLANQMRITLEIIIQWLRQSGLKVNDAKTEICLFYRKDTPLLIL